MKTLLLIASLAVVLTANAADTQPSAQQSTKSAELVLQAASHPYLFRQGDVAVAAKSVALLEEATRLDRDNVEGWTALGVAQLMQVSATLQRGGDRAALLAAAQQARAAYARALELDPMHALALSGHGATLVMLAGLQREPGLSGQGVAELDRAVQLQPSAVRPRLLRAFTSVNLPRRLRDPQAIQSDVGFLLGVAGKSRAGAMLHILLGDLHAELGRQDQALLEYAAAQQQFAGVAGLVAERSRTLQAGGVPTASIAELRAALSSQCTLCHAP